MKIKLLFISYNRPKYTRLSLKRLCHVAPDNARIVIWDNGSSKTTVDEIRKFEAHPKIESIIYKKENYKLWLPTKWFFENSDGYDLIGKVDDDCLIPNNCYKILQKAHEDIQKVGILGCWSGMPEDFKYNIAKKKIIKYGNHQILRNCWTGGSGYLMKKKIIKEIGLLRKNESFTGYCLRAAIKGYINGWYYPLLYQDHMDDPRSKNSQLRNDADFKKYMPLSAKNFNIKTRKEWINRLKASSYQLQMYSYDPKDFIGIRYKFKKKIKNFFGINHIPTVK